jgi:hypothetical protein
MLSSWSGRGPRTTRLGAALLLCAATLQAQSAALSLGDLGAAILKGSKTLQAMRGAKRGDGQSLLQRPVVGFAAGECTLDVGGDIPTVECVNERAIDEAAARPALESLLARARAELRAPTWTESKWLAGREGASFKHASGAEIDIGLPPAADAGLPSTYGPVMLIAMAAVE